MKIIFWISLFIVFYTFAGYAIVLYLLVKLKRGFRGKIKTVQAPPSLPAVTLIIAAYNEVAIIEEKIRNTLALQYPEQQLTIIFVTDGSVDGTPEAIRAFPQLELFHSPGRKGKIQAIHRAMQFVKTEITVFSDANTGLNPDALLLIAKHYDDPKVGAVSGEKRVSISAISDATGGEGFYWKYESLLKKWDSELFSVVGAAGELFSIRTSLYEPVPPDTILDDFMISLTIAQNGYRIVYEPAACAMENSSASTKEELKRKIRIAAGGIQSILRLKKILNPFHFPILTFQYLSHRVLRWTITPFLLIVALVFNILIVLSSSPVFYQYLLISQSLLYLLAAAGWYFQSKQIRVKLLFAPYYFCLMNYAVIRGIFRFLFKGQTVIWEKVQRK